MIRQRVFGVAFLAVVGPAPLVTDMLSTDTKFGSVTAEEYLHLDGGTDGAGSLPYIGPVGSRTGIPQGLTTATPEFVVNSHGHAISGAMVIVSHPALGIVALAHTDAGGLVVLELPVIPGLELALPGVGLAGIPVTAGEPAVVIVP